MIRIALLSSYTSDLLPEMVNEALINYSLKCKWYIAGFNQFSKEIMTSDSSSRRFKPDCVLLLFQSADFLADEKGMFNIIRASRKVYHDAAILVANQIDIEIKPLRLLQLSDAHSNRHKIQNINKSLLALQKTLPNLYVIDIEGLFLKYGLDKMIDFRYFYLAKMPFSHFGLSKAAGAISLSLSAVFGKRKKCLVLDIDNVLWGGVLGEVGVRHLILSDDAEGKAFYDFQKCIKMLFDKGIILAICSKNDEYLVLKAIREHPYMILKEEMFSVIRINWLDKVTNIESIAKELNIGLDSLVFLDDSPHERASVKSILSEVTVPDMPKDFCQYSKFIAELPYFETYEVTKEDKQRGRMYAVERQRKTLQKSIPSYDDFLKSLNIKIKIMNADNFNITRIAQLIQKTNQFNFTTRRYTDMEINKLSKKNNFKVYCISSQDKLGDLGIVGVAILEFFPNYARLDSFLLSCRILGRGIEEAFLSQVFNIAKKNYAESLIIEFYKTKKNNVAREFLLKYDLLPVKNKQDYPLGKAMKFPKWIQLIS